MLSVINQKGTFKVDITYYRVYDKSIFTVNQNITNKPSILLGTYPSKERAEEVFKEMLSKEEVQNSFCEINNTYDGCIPCKHFAIYKMPID